MFLVKTPLHTNTLSHTNTSSQVCRLVAARFKELRMPCNFNPRMQHFFIANLWFNFVYQTCLCSRKFSCLFCKFYVFVYLCCFLCQSCIHSHVMETQIVLWESDCKLPKFSKLTFDMLSLLYPLLKPSEKRYYSTNSCFEAKLYSCSSDGLLFLFF